MQKADFVWMDGDFIPFNKAQIHPLTLSLHYASCVFEGLRAYASPKGMHIFRLQDHTKRLLKSASMLGINPAFSQDELNNAQIKLLAKNNFTSNVYIRPFIFLGMDSMSMCIKNAPIHTAIAAWQMDEYLGKNTLEKGIDICISSYRKPKDLFAHCKVSANYLLSQMAKQDALNAGFDDALFLDDLGCVAEGTSQCIFVLLDDVLLTPPCAFTLKSITQDSVKLLCKDLGIKVEERQITREDLYVADEAFFTGSASEIVPINSIDKRKLKSPNKEITKAIQKAFFDLVYAKYDKYSHFLTKITKDSNAS